MNPVMLSLLEDLIDLHIQRNEHTDFVSQNNIKESLIRLRQAILDTPLNE